ncbi:MAG: PaaI family thioesterase [Alphaproteobacteria bacterium]|nr:PaaI family thioesterase [Alphaproteobacteria bacterium]MDP6566096.1 PaaI family thioesterase [Alphaproteobacteria bacterium]MDP6816246.1 PaaI family thioesterase [Alphaproteobacteria bacterium]
MTSLLDGIQQARGSGDLRASIETVPYFKWLGLEVELREDELVTILPFQDMLVGNPLLPALHGGVTGAFLESAAMISLIGAMETVKLPKIINITIEYLRSARPLDSFATAVVTKQGRRVANVRATAWQDDRDAPIAIANAHFLIA